ncbi:MAG TPA: hypothetical protein VLS89_07060 [Candidatus Nanopelagicales bacterium]|nr:hypothetical protein [Candidatus Nanopelagicales bacterium]
MTVAAVHPRNTFTWLEALLDLLPSSKQAARFPVPPEELEPFLEIGRYVLGARDLADVQARLDGSIMQLRGLELPMSSQHVARPDDVQVDLPKKPQADSPAGRALGLNVSDKLLRAIRAAAGLLRMAVQALGEARTGSSRGSLVIRALRVRPWSLHDGRVVPHALVASAIVQSRGLVAFSALLGACVDGRRPEPWLSSALADEVLLAAREVARIFASAGYDVAPIEPEELIDLEAVFREAEAADAALVASFEEDVRAGRVGVPEDE